MVKKEELIEVANRALNGVELDFFTKAVEDDKPRLLLKVTEENHERAKEELFKSARGEKCDPIVISHFKHSDELYKIVMDFYLEEFDREKSKL